MAVPRLITPPPFAVARSSAAPSPPTPGVQSAMDYFITQSRTFAASCTRLRKTLEAPAPSLTLARQQLIDCRCQYKKIEAFLEYFFRSSSTIYNRPPKYEAEEPDMEYQSPIGLQVIESLLYETPATPKTNANVKASPPSQNHLDHITRANRKALLDQARAVENAASDLPALLYNFKAGDPQLLESLRLELIRIIALDITGYEAPLLKSGIRESRAALEAFSLSLQPYLQDNKQADSLQYFLNKTITLLNNKTSFDSFDRLTFLKEAALPLQRQLSVFIREEGLELNTGKTLNYIADDIFSPDALLPAPGQPPAAAAATSAATTTTSIAATPSPAAATLITLGRQLFSDPTLSINSQKSCASCHNPEKSFTDGRPFSIAFDGHHLLDRNTPTLLYSAFQYNQFWDGRVRTLEDQIRTVLHDTREMNADTASLAKHGGLEKTVAALAAYVRSLHPMNSRFDQYLRGKPTLTDREKAGANLFMGKAQCATCHFIPLFNGLIPPYYTQTEFEVLGTTSTDHLRKTATAAKTNAATSNPGSGNTRTAAQTANNQKPTTTHKTNTAQTLTLSPDQGRYKIYPFPFYKGAFKTPTIRNAAQTGPYMHNGAFHSLETVLDFYNKGGGAGLGLDVPDQTLPPTPLHLSTDEINDIILFIHTLTDSPN